MSVELENDTNIYKYYVVSVEKTDPPPGMPGDDWYRYVIGQGRSRIEGLKPGSLQAVTEHAELFAEGLNARASKGNSAYVARNRK
jgi:hypothetical protein